MDKITLESLLSLSEEYEKFITNKPKYGIYYSFDAIFDEEKSVRWNREEVVRRNALLDDKEKEFHNQVNQKRINLVDTIKKYIVQEIKVSDEKAEQVYNYIYNLYSYRELHRIIYILNDFLVLFNYLCKEEK